MMDAAYNSNYQIVQAPGVVMILTEMIHDVRIVPLDGRPAPPKNVRQWMGVSRGRWEGNTLVVETTNFKRETSLAGSTANTRLTERFTRTDADTLLYEFTVDDSTTWTRPWTFAMPLTMNDAEPIQLYECHEGNYGLRNILSAARAEEREAASATKP